MSRREFNRPKGTLYQNFKHKDFYTQYHNSIISLKEQGYKPRHIAKILNIDIKMINCHDRYFKRS
jgi:hypothetical protein